MDRASTDPEWADWAETAKLRVKTEWYARIPRTAAAGVRGAARFRFRVCADGRVLDGEALSHAGPDEFLHVAWAAISATPWPELPEGAEDRDDGVLITYSFHYNLQPSEAKSWDRRATRREAKLKRQREKANP